jgi:hypothetical protein
MEFRDHRGDGSTAHERERQITTEIYGPYVIARMLLAETRYLQEITESTGSCIFSVGDIEDGFVALIKYLEGYMHGMGDAKCMPAEPVGE